MLSLRGEKTVVIQIARILLNQKSWIQRPFLHTRAIQLSSARGFKSATDYESLGSFTFGQL